MSKLIEHKVLQNVITPEERDSIEEVIMWSSQVHLSEDGRNTANIPETYESEHNVNSIVPRSVFEKLNKIALMYFSDTAKPSYFKYMKYSPRFGIPLLRPHVDDNACTYTIDVQLRSTVRWPLYVSGIRYEWEDLGAMLYNGVDELHWRCRFPSENINDFATIMVAHYVEPDHWFFTEEAKKNNPRFNPVYHREYRKRENSLKMNFIEQLSRYPNE